MGLPAIVYYGLMAIGFAIVVKMIGQIFKNSALTSLLIGFGIFVAAFWLIGRGFLHMF